MTYHEQKLQRQGGWRDEVGKVSHHFISLSFHVLVERMSFPTGTLLNEVHHSIDRSIHYYG